MYLSNCENSSQLCYFILLILKNIEIFSLYKLQKLYISRLWSYSLFPLIHFYFINKIDIFRRTKCDRLQLAVNDSVIAIVNLMLN